jgi:hypothetical protein
MTSKHLFPSLDTDGWVESPIKVADYMLSHFFLSDYSQTAFFRNKVASFAWLLQRHQGNLTALFDETQQILSSYFSTQFSNVEVQVTEVPDTTTSNKTGLSLFLEFVDADGTTHNLSRLVKYSGMKVSEVLAVVNS